MFGFFKPSSFTFSALILQKLNLKFYWIEGQKVQKIKQSISYSGNLTPCQVDMIRSAERFVKPLARSKAPVTRGFFIVQGI